MFSKFLQFNMRWTMMLAMLPLVLGGMLSSTDTITWGGDVSRAGYQPTHNMDPAVVGSSQFGQIFKTLLPGNYQNTLEQIFSQPLVYTLNDGIQYLFIATTQNNIYKINAKTGVIVASRNMHIPFLTSDLDACVDINPFIGVTATGVIDPDTDTWYLTAKTYQDQSDQIKGRQNGRYYFHAINVDDLSERSGFPRDLEGTLNRNGNVGNRMFQAGEAHQRPALLLYDQYVYAGFASHCVLYNFTGWIMGFDKTTGNTIEAFAMEAGPESNTAVKGGGVWMSGGGISSDGKGSMYYGTGNGYASQLDGISVPGRQPPSALEEAAVHMKIADDGSLTVVDFFMPWEKKQLDGADKDLGTTPLELLPTDVFTCPNVARMGVITGKSGKTYFLNIDNLGGYQMGANHLDAVPQVYQNENSVYAGAGVYPLEGGYIYINVIQYPTHVFKFSCDNNGNPVFTYVADTPEKNAYVLGVGHGTTTSLNGQVGTGLLWTSDVEGSNLRIYNAVPSNGFLTLINSFVIPGVTKFTRPVFGDARAYMGTTQGALYGFGSPVNLPFNCSAPYDFGVVALKNSSAPLTVQCQAVVNTVVTAVSLAGNKNFVVSGVPSLPLTVQAGSNFSFQAMFTPGQVGPLSSSVLLNTTANGYSPNMPVALKGTGESLNPLLAINPNTVSFTGVITGQQQGGVNSSVILYNQGNGILNITGIDFSIVSEGGATVQPNMTAGGPQVQQFTFYNVPTSIPAKSQAIVNVNFNPSQSGNFAVYLTVHSNGGNSILDVLATSGTYPAALIEFQAADGSGNWIPYTNGTTFTFGAVTEQQTKTLKMRLTNSGDKNAGRLSVTVSKPPFGVPGIIGAANAVDLGEGTSLGAGESATASLFCSVPKSQVNVDSYNGSTTWTLNTGDPNMGKVFIPFSCQAVSEQVGPLAANGSATYRYDFCAVENNPGRQLSNMLFASPNNTNEMCITACGAAGYKYCGTQYLQECWAGNSVPIQSTLDRDCNYACTGSINETCGGNGYFHNASYISLFVNPALPEGAKNPTGGNNGGNTATPSESPAVIGSYSFIGCYTEASAGRALPNRVDNDAGMTLEYCASQMQAYTYFGVEYGQECYGGNVLGQGAALTNIGDCSIACPGNSSEPCGAGNRLQLYQSNSTISVSASTTTGAPITSPTASSMTPASIGAFSYVGCYTEGTAGRALADSRVDNDPAMTLEFCAGQMQAYQYFGVEYGQECYGGSTLGAGSVSAPASDCSFPCPGNANELCGAGGRLQLYQKNSSLPTSSSGVLPTMTSTAVSTPTGPATVQSITGWSYVGCYTEGTSDRALNGLENPVSSNKNTVEVCGAACAGFTYFGVEYGSECYCGNFFTAGAVIASGGNDTTQNGCSVTCQGNSLEYCGGGNRLNVYKSSPQNTTTTTASGIGSSTIAMNSSTSVTASSSTIISTTATPTPSTVPLVSGKYAFVGCYSEATNGRALSDTANLTAKSVDNCASFCAANGPYAYFGVEYFGECYCGNTLNAGSVPSTGCTFPCSLNQTQFCGGSNVLDLYKLSTSTTSTSTTSIISTTSTSISSTSSTVSSTSTSATPTPSTVPMVSGPYSFVGCYSEATAGRALSADANLTAKSVDNCKSYCFNAVNGPYNYFGVEYFGECYCGNSLNAGSVPSTGCTFACSSNSTQICGGSNVLDLYQLTSKLNATSSMVTSTLSSTTISSTVTSTTIISSISTTSTAPSSISTTPSPSTVPLVSGPYSFVGCYSEATNGRALSDAANLTAKSVDNCAAFCKANGQYTYFGVEYFGECYCGNQLNAGSVPSTGCTFPCDFNKTQICGGSAVLDLYELTVNLTTSSSLLASTTKTSTTATSASTQSSITVSSATTTLPSTKISSSFIISTTTSTTSATPTPTGPVTVLSLPGWSYLGCYTEGTNMRALSDLQNPIPAQNVTVENCAAACSQYKYFGVEYSGECYCGNVINTGSVLAPGGNDTSQNGCSMTCNGNPFEYCGGGNRLNMYKTSPIVTSISVLKTSSSSLSTSVVNIPSTSTTSLVSSTTTGSSTTTTSSSMTVKSSTTSTSSTSSTLSSTTTSSSSVAVKASTTSTSSTSAFSSTTTTPTTSTTSRSVAVTTTLVTTTTKAPITTTSSIASSATSLLISTVSTITVTTTTSSKTTASTSAAPTVAQIPKWNYIGCYTEGSSSRALSSVSYVASNMTVEYCASLATGKYDYFGVEYSSECYMGNTLSTGSNQSVTTDCSMSCAGNKTELCGGSQRLNLYQATASIVPTTPSVVQGNANYTYYNCVVEPSGGRALPTQILASNTMTVEYCLSLASSYKYVGLEYGRECWASNSLNAAATNATASTQCGKICSGNSTEICGDSSRLTTYLRTAH